MQPCRNHVSDNAPLRICLASAEAAPLAKTGGLADVTAALSAELHRSGHDLRLLIPRYADIATSGLAIEPVAGLQEIPMRIGRRDGHVSFDATTLPGSDLKIHLLRCPELYERPGIYGDGDDEHLRFILLSHAAIAMCQHLGFAPDVFHCHDWHTALVPLYLKTAYAWDRLFAATRSVLTIHNIGYQGVFGAGIIADLQLGSDVRQLHQQDLGEGRINFLKTGVLHADALTTVSPTYAREIQTADYGMGLEELLRARGETLHGILNGVDYGVWNPETDRLIPENYSSHSLSGKAACKRRLLEELGMAAAAERPLLGVVSRLVVQKGIDLMQEVLPKLLQRRQFCLAVLGSGEPRYERFFARLEQRFGDRVRFCRGYSDELAHRIEAASDMFLMPSLYEPCGLNQMYSLRYGTVPIVRQTGGLADSVEPIDPENGSGTGILFRRYESAALAEAIETGLDFHENRALWRQIMQNGMAQDFSWAHQADEYDRLFRALVNRA